MLPCGTLKLMSRSTTWSSNANDTLSNTTAGGTASSAGRLSVSRPDWLFFPPASSISRQTSFIARPEAGAWRFAAHVLMRSGGIDALPLDRSRCLAPAASGPPRHRRPTRPAGAAARATSTGSGASSHSPTNGTEARRATRSIAFRSCGRANTASTIVAWPAAIDLRRALGQASRRPVAMACGVIALGRRDDRARHAAQPLADLVAAEHHRAGHGADGRRQAPAPAWTSPSPTNRRSRRATAAADAGARGHRRDTRAPRLELRPRAPASLCSRAAVALVFARTAARHDRNSGSSASPPRSPRLREIAVPHHVGVARQPPSPEIHQQERQVVADVGAGDLVVELDAVEQRRPPVEQHDVAQVQIAVALAHEARLRAARRAAPPRDRAQRRDSSSPDARRSDRERRSVSREPVGVAFDDPRHPGWPP